jgi:hypothetical protein
MALTDEQNKELETLFRTELQKQYLRGLRAGIKTASSVCLEKINDSSKPLLKRIEGVKKYCLVALKPDFLTKGIDDIPTTTTTEDTANEVTEGAEIAENSETSETAK